MAEEKKKRNWLIKVNSMKYNILGSAREFGEKIPWRIEDEISLDDENIVYFYLVGSKGNNNSVNELYGRFIFEGKVTAIKNADEIMEENVDKNEDKNENKKEIYDSKYWSDNVKENKVKSSDCKYAIIRIDKNLYDKKITSGDVDNRIWAGEYAQKDVYELDDKMVESIRRHILRN